MQAGLTMGLALAGLGVCMAAPAQAGSFAVVGQVSGAAQVGAVQGGVLYGTTDSGDGTVFAMKLSGSQAGAATVLHSFVAASDGSAPDGRMAVDGAGNLYGAAFHDGANGGGTLWEVAAGGRFQVLHQFGAGNDGVGPLQGPTLAGGVLYGSTYMGAANNNGILFGLTPGSSGSYATLYNFLSGADGHCPFSGIAVTGGGSIVGTTVGYGYGGNPNGSVFRYSSAGVLTTLYVFRDQADGEWPDQAPILSGGTIYGTTHVRHGAASDGAVWSLSGAGVFSVLHDLGGHADGSGPNSPLVVGPDGALYGTTHDGGPGGHGTLFRVTIAGAGAGAFSVVHAFDGGSGGGAPTGNLVRAGGTIYGGSVDGTVFALMP